MIGFDWSPDQNQWLVSMDGAPYTAADTGQLMAGTVVLQSVQVYDSAISDIAGSVSPLAQTTGSGRALVLRDGRAFPAIRTGRQPPPVLYADRGVPGVHSHSARRCTARRSADSSGCVLINFADRCSRSFAQAFRG
ncbi:DUF3048 C-terminal domain-containing protein [Nocardia grenadensis]|uniref:DUF3048 C-terminal domain-containing protein n=1 Tax=Nocardia grenadensis TaxID=931537 RepID=UPI003D71903E